MKSADKGRDTTFHCSALATHMDHKHGARSKIKQEKAARETTAVQTATPPTKRVSPSGGGGGPSKRQVRQQTIKNMMPQVKQPETAGEKNAREAQQRVSMMHFYVYCTAAVSLSIFNDDYFRKMMQTGQPNLYATLDRLTRSN
jgi:hypothetical protein